MATSPDEDRARQAKAALDRATRESTGFADSALAKMSDHFSASDAQGQDAAEIWGRRIGRILGLGFLILLVINLFTHWFF